MAIQGYDKTSTYSNIATGNVIEAAYFTNEYAEIFDAFKKTTSTTATGHRHDGGDAMGGYVALLSDSDNDTKITLETISISGGAPSYTDSDTITIIAGSATIATIDSGDIKVAANKGITFGDAAEKIEGDGTDLTISGNNIKLTATADVIIPADVGITFGTGEKIEGDSTDLTVTSGGKINLTATSDVVIPADVGITFGTGEKIEGNNTDITVTSGADINLTATSDVNIPSGVGVTFGDDGEKIEGNGTDLTISASADLNLTATTDINIPANVGLTFGDDAEKIEGDGTDLTISGNNINLTATADVNIPSGVGLTFATTEKIESDGTDLSVTVGSGGDINVPASIGITFGDDGEKIEGDGTDLTISSSALATVDAGTDIVLDAGGGDIFFKDDGTTFGSATNTSGDLIIKSGTTTALTFSGANVTGSGTFEATTITASTSIVPDASGGADIGSTSAEWGDIYIADDKKIKFGSGQDVTIEYDEDGTDTLLVAGGSVTISDDLKLNFGTGKDFSIEYDEDGNDTTVAVGSGGFSFGPHGTSTGNTTSIQFQELAANGAHYVGFKAADSISANVIWTLPNADGSANQIIKTDGSGALSWTTPSTGAVTAINNATANELVTIGSTTTELDAEGNLTFDGSTLALTGDATISDDLGLVSDAALLTFGANSEVTLTHVHDTGLLLNSTMQLQFNDASQFINAPSATILDINATDEIELNATAVDLNGTLDVSGTAQVNGVLTAAAKLDMNGTELILDANADTSITADTDDQIDINIGGTDVVTLTNSSLVLKGTTPTLTIGDAGAEDTKIVFDGNAQDFHIGLDDTADDLVIGLGSTLGTTTHMAFDEAGTVIKPLQPAFSAGPASQQVNFAVTSDVDIAFGTEIFDVNADFASNTFTAPVTGKYLLTYMIMLLNLDSASAYYRIRLVTSNRNYDNLNDTDFGQDAVYWTISSSFVVDMDAGDTASVQVRQAGGTVQSDVETDSRFTGCLLA